MTKELLTGDNAQKNFTEDIMKKLTLILAIFTIFFSTSAAGADDTTNAPVTTISVSAYPVGFCGRLRFVSVLWISPGGTAVKKVQDRIEQGLGKDYIQDPEYYFLPANMIDESIIETSSSRSSHIKPEFNNGYIVVYQTMLVLPGDHIKFIFKAQGKYYQPLICDSLEPFINLDGSLLCNDIPHGEYDFEIP
ncbi:MAG: hypothetical protein WA055_01605 [Candidatus Moraniibacteriota bacterium]